MRNIHFSENPASHYQTNYIMLSTISTLICSAFFIKGRKNRRASKHDTNSNARATMALMTCPPLMTDAIHHSSKLNVHGVTGDFNDFNAVFQLGVYNGTPDEYNMTYVSETTPSVFIKTATKGNQMRWEFTRDLGCEFAQGLLSVC
jgi:hypothetical protein